MLKIVQAPSEVLSQVSKQIEGNPPTLDKGFIKQMERSLDSASDPKGVGLAAPQIGKPLSIFITKPTEKTRVHTFINPKIVNYLDKPRKGSKAGKQKKDKKLEGCLSLKDIWGEVRRFDEVVLEYYDQNGKFHSKKFTGFMATIVQHEVDHLNGILFPKRVLEQNGKLYKSSKDDKGELIFDPIEI